MTPQEKYELALKYYNGTEEKEKDYKKAYDLFKEAAEAGHVGSMSYLGRIFSLGNGTDLNYNKAIQWLLEKPCARDPRSPVPLTLAVQNSLTL